MAKMSICSSCGTVKNINTKCSCKKDENNRKAREYYAKNKQFLKPLKSKRWQKLRERMIARDNGICQRCFLKYEIINSEQLQVHHIKNRVDFPDLIFEESNLLTLCKNCNLQLGQGDLDFPYEYTEEEYIPKIF